MQQSSLAKLSPSERKKLKGKPNHLIADSQRQEIERLMRQQMAKQTATPTAALKPAPAEKDNILIEGISSEENFDRCSLSPVSQGSSISLSDEEEEHFDKPKVDKAAEYKSADKVKFTTNEFEEILDYGHGSASEEEEERNNCQSKLMIEPVATAENYGENESATFESKQNLSKTFEEKIIHPSTKSKSQASVEQGKTEQSADDQAEQSADQSLSETAADKNLEQEKTKNNEEIKPSQEIEKSKESEESKSAKPEQDKFEPAAASKAEDVGTSANPVNLDDDDDVICDPTLVSANLCKDFEKKESSKKGLPKKFKNEKKKIVDLRSLLNKKKSESETKIEPEKNKKESKKSDKELQKPFQACWYCGMDNHSQVNCRKRKKNGHPMVGKPMCPAKSNNSENFCINCSVNGHKLRNCPGFIGMEPAERWKVANKSGLICFKCLNYGHMVTECDSHDKCLFEGCRQQHHMLLHNPDDVNNSDIADNNKEMEPQYEQVPQEEKKIQTMLTTLRHQAPARVATRHKPKETCKICSEDHHVSECPERFCKKCEQKGHFTINCPNYPQITCFICKEPHLTKFCKNKMAKCGICVAEGHTSRECPQRSFVCINCQGPHHIKNCPVLVCQKCGEAGHTPQYCPMDLEEPCGKCQGNHHPINCQAGEDSSIICHQCQGNHHIKECPSAVCKKCGEVGHWIKDCPKSLKCFKCDIFGHRIENCPFVECKNCGAYGHWIKSCTNKKNEFRRRKADQAEAEVFKNVISIDYHHVGGANAGGPANQNVVPQVVAASNSKSLMAHFYERLLSRGRNPELASQMMLYWRLAEHSEHSLRALFYKHTPCTRDTLRLLLLSELAKAPSSCRPMDITSSDLLDATIDYFMPQASSISDFGTDFSMSAQLTHQFFRNQNPGAAATPSTSYSISNPLDNAAEGRYKSLQPLQEYIAKKMRSLSSMFGIQEGYIMEVSTTIQRLLAEVGLCLFTLRRHFTTLGKESLGESILDKMSTSRIKLPERVSPSYVVAIVTDFLGDYCK